MYSLIRGYSRVLSGSGRLALINNEDLLQTPVYLVGDLFRQLKMVLVHNSEPDKELMFDYYAKAAEFHGDFNQNKTLAEWLVYNANKTLTNDPRVKLVTKTVNQADAWEADFHVDVSVPGGVPSAEMPKASMRDLYLTHPTLPPKLVEENVLISTAGYLHRVTSSSRAVYAVEGGRTGGVSNDTSTSIISFANLGGCSTIPISPAMLQNLPEPGEKLNQAIIINTPNFDWTNKTAFLVLAGKLVPAGKTFNQIGEQSFEFNWLRYPTTDHFFEAEDILDLSSVRNVLTKREGNVKAVAVDEMFGRDFITAYMSCAQSFLLAVNTSGVFVEYDDLEPTKTPGQYLTGIQPTGVVVSDTGRIMDYLVKQAGLRWSIQSNVALRSNYLYEKSPWHLHNITDPREVGSKQKFQMRARMLTIGIDQFE